MSYRRRRPLAILTRVQRESVVLAAQRVLIMSQAQEVKRRQIEEAVAAGERWAMTRDERAETLRRLRRGGPEAADHPRRVSRYRLREAAKSAVYARAGVTSAVFAERRIGPTLDLDDLPPNEAARRAGIPVGRIVELTNRGTPGEGFATGFLVAGSLLITNHHVFASARECSGCGVQFGYERAGNALAAGTVFELDAERFFFTDEKLDFTVVAVSPTGTPNAPLEGFNSLRLIPATGKILVGQPISIIQYPDGGPKKYGVRDNELLSAPTDADLFLQYTTDTLPGSSGSPAFNKDWEIVALHHSGVPEVKDGQILTNSGTPWKSGMSDDDIHWVANEGVRISCICERLKTANVDKRLQEQLKALVATFGDDFSGLPAVESQMPQNLPSWPASSVTSPLAVVVNGTANFYVGTGPTPVSPAEVAVPPVVALPVEAVEKKLRFDPDYDHRPGYKRDFLTTEFEPPSVVEGRLGEILMSDGKPLVLRYHHYSLVMNKRRRMQMWSAVNVDYTAAKRRKSRDEFGTDTWVADPRIPGRLQIEDQELYEPAKKFDRGHIVRRDDTAWGDTAEEETFANSDSFHWTNCTPQHEQFNRDRFGFHGLWGGLENHIQAQAKNVGKRMSIFAGPVLDNDQDIKHDFGGGPMLVPRRFWKVLLVVQKKGQELTPRAYGFVLDQSKAIDEFGLERFSAGRFEVYQQTLASISELTGVLFDDVVLRADSMGDAPEEARRRPRLLESLEDVRL
jgi:endonuclease G, mitochondrial